MNHHELPTADRPDNYSGTWNRHRVRYLFADTTAGLWHLGVGGHYEGSYCTRMNPLGRIDLAGVKLHYRNGGYRIIPREGGEVSIFMPDRVAMRRPLTYRNQVLEVCPHCLTMAAVTAEMYGQNTYPVKRLLKALAGTSTPAGK